MEPHSHRQPAPIAGDLPLGLDRAEHPAKAETSKHARIPGGHRRKGRHVPLIKGFDDLTFLCTEFESWYNTWQPHMTLEGLRPDDLYYDRKLEKPQRDAKTVPHNIERHVFQETRITGYRLKDAA